MRIKDFAEELNFEGMTTFRIGFLNNNVNINNIHDETEFEAENIDELQELYETFCEENGFHIDTVQYIEEVESPHDQVVYTQKTSRALARFINEHPLPGWYVDANGYYGIMLGRYWLMIFLSDDGQLEITVDTFTKEGTLDNNIWWETPEDDIALMETALRLMAKYSKQLEY